MPTLDWIGKKAVLNHHREVPYHLLKCDKEHSVGDSGSGNLLVQSVGGAEQRTLSLHRGERERRKRDFRGD